MDLNNLSQEIAGLCVTTEDFPFLSSSERQEHQPDATMENRMEMFGTVVVKDTRNPKRTRRRSLRIMHALESSENDTLSASEVLHKDQEPLKGDKRNTEMKHSRRQSFKMESNSDLKKDDTDSTAERLSMNTNKKQEGSGDEENVTPPKISCRRRSKIPTKCSSDHNLKYCDSDKKIAKLHTTFKPENRNVHQREPNTVKKKERTYLKSKIPVGSKNLGQMSSVSLKKVTGSVKIGKTRDMKIKNIEPPSCKTVKKLNQSSSLQKHNSSRSRTVPVYGTPMDMNVNEDLSFQGVSNVHIVPICQKSSSSDSLQETETCKKKRMELENAYLGASCFQSTSSDCIPNDSSYAIAKRTSIPVSTVQQSEDLQDNNNDNITNLAVKRKQRKRRQSAMFEPMLKDDNISKIQSLRVNDSTTIQRTVQDNGEVGHEVSSSSNELLCLPVSAGAPEEHQNLPVEDTVAQPKEIRRRSSRMTNKVFYGEQTEYPVPQKQKVSPAFPKTDELDVESLREIYEKPKYVAPNNHSLETIFESAEKKSKIKRMRMLKSCLDDCIVIDRHRKKHRASMLKKLQLYNSEQGKVSSKRMKLTEEEFDEKLKSLDNCEEREMFGVQSEETCEMKMDVDDLSQEFVRKEEEDCSLHATILNNVASSSPETVLESNSSDSKLDPCLSSLEVLSCPQETEMAALVENPAECEQRFQQFKDRTEVAPEIGFENSSHEVLSMDTDDDSIPGMLSALPTVVSESDIGNIGKTVLGFSPHESKHVPYTPSSECKIPVYFPLHDVAVAQNSAETLSEQIAHPIQNSTELVSETTTAESSSTITKTTATSLGESSLVVSPGDDSVFCSPNEGSSSFYSPNVLDTAFVKTSSSFQGSD